MRILSLIKEENKIVKKQNKPLAVVATTLSLVDFLLPLILLGLVVNNVSAISDSIAIVTVLLYDLFFLMATLVFYELNVLQTNQRKLLVATNCFNLLIVLLILIVFILLVIGIAS